MNAPSAAVKDDMLKRLRRIEGQVRGVQKMIEEDRECNDVIQQLAAIRSAVHQANLALVRDYACRCLLEADDESSAEQRVDSLVNVLSKIP